MGLQGLPHTYFQIGTLLQRGPDNGTFRSDATAGELQFLLGQLLEAAARMTAEHQAGVEKAAALVTSVFLYGTQNRTGPAPRQGQDRARRLTEAENGRLAGPLSWLAGAWPGPWEACPAMARHLPDPGEQSIVDSVFAHSNISEDNEVSGANRGSHAAARIAAMTVTRWRFMLCWSAAA
jgi:hypothetical protein